MSTRGARWVTAGAVLAVSGLVVAAAYWMIQNAPDPAESTAEQIPGVLQLSELRFADCYAIARDNRGNLTAGDGVYVVTCDDEHDGQVIDQVRLESLEWAGSTAMKASAQNQCSTAFNRYRASILDADDLLPGYFLPNEALWQQGNRTITCTLTMPTPFIGNRL